jgi:hypothetical protein
MRHNLERTELCPSENTGTNAVRDRRSSSRTRRAVPSARITQHAQRGIRLVYLRG